MAVAKQQVLGAGCPRRAWRIGTASRAARIGQVQHEAADTTHDYVIAA
ncbi:MAG TPA: hypothetical protein VHX37_07805 [Acidobacteriaceae bacterium]|nr:hypothetical protein [Acidobacteriaceae bacterium]